MGTFAMRLQIIKDSLHRLIEKQVTLPMRNSLHRRNVVVINGIKKAVSNELI